MAELHVFEYGGTTFGNLGKISLNAKDYCVKTIGWGEKIMFLTMKHGKVGYFHVTD